MRKKTIKFIIDSCFWVLISVLPLVFYGIYLIHSDEGTILTFAEFFGSQVLGIIPLTSNIIKDGLIAIFGYSGVMPFFDDANVFFDFCAYFVIVNIVHIFIDVILWIPRFAHKLLDKAVSED